MSRDEGSEVWTRSTSYSQEALKNSKDECRALNILASSSRFIRYLIFIFIQISGFLFFNYYYVQWRAGGESGESILPPRPIHVKIIYIIILKLFFSREEENTFNQNGCELRNLVHGR